MQPIRRLHTIHISATFFWQLATGLWLAFLPFVLGGWGFGSGIAPADALVQQLATAYAGPPLPAALAAAGNPPVQAAWVHAYVAVCVVGILGCLIAGMLCFGLRSMHAVAYALWAPVPGLAYMAYSMANSVALVYQQINYPAYSVLALGLMLVLLVVRRRSPVLWGLIVGNAVHITLLALVFWALSHFNPILP